MKNTLNLCEAEVKKNIILVETGQPLTLPLRVLNESCEFKKAWNKAYDIFHQDKVQEEIKQNKDKISKKNKSYYEKNKDKIKAYHKAYFEKNKDKMSKYYKAYREKNKDKIAKQKKAYCEKNKDKIKAYYLRNIYKLYSR